MHWSHLLALGGGGREGNSQDENGVLYSLLGCQLAESGASPTHCCLGLQPTVERRAAGVRLTVCRPCGSLCWNGTEPWLRALALFAAVTQGQVFFLSEPQHPQL